LAKGSIAGLLPKEKAHGNYDRVVFPTARRDGWGHVAVVGGEIYGLSVVKWPREGCPRGLMLCRES